MRLFLIIVILLSGCYEMEDGPEFPRRCNGYIVEELIDGEWETWQDCSQYAPAHSGVLCPRQCCDFGDFISCGFCDAGVGRDPTAFKHTPKNTSLPYPLKPVDAGVF